MKHNSSIQDMVWLVYERPDLNSFREVNTGFFAPLVAGWENSDKTVFEYETYREKVSRNEARKTIENVHPASFYKNFRMEEI